MDIAGLILNPKPKINEHKDKSGYYSDAYFRIGRNGYTGRVWEDERIEDGAWKSERREAFTAEVGAMFAAHGWTIEDGKFNGSANTAHNGKSCLYLHPQSFSGIIENSLIEEVTAFLSGGKSFELEAVDVYEEIFDWTRQEIDAHFEQMRADVKAAIIERYTTKRRNLFIVGLAPLHDAINSFFVKAVPREPDSTSDRIRPAYGLELFNEMLEAGEIVAANTRHGTGYRFAGNAGAKKEAGAR